MICSIDTCFLIDWARYRKKELIGKIFKKGFITEEALEEIETESTLKFVSKLLEEDFLIIYPLKIEVRGTIEKLIDISIKDDRIKAIDPPEAFAFAIALKENCICLTENKGILRLVELYDEFSKVKVWRSFELLKQMDEKGLIKFEEELKNYSIDTGHEFRK